MHLHHLALRTADVDGLVRFYASLFDLEVVRDARPRSVWLGLSDGAVLMVERREPGEPPPPAGSMELVAFRVDDARKRDLARRIHERGVGDGATEHTLYLRDPDGRRVAVSTHPLQGTANQCARGPGPGID